MASKPAAASPPPTESTDSPIHVIVKCVWWNTTKILRLNIIIDEKLQNCNPDGTYEEDNIPIDDYRKYSLCSLLLQLGRLFQIQPPCCAPSSSPLSICHKVLECWSLQRVMLDNPRTQQPDEGKCNHQYKKKIGGLCDIQHGDELLFSFGDYFEKIPGNKMKEEEIDVLELLPKQYKNLVTVAVIDDEKDCHDDDNSNNKKTTDNKNIECIEILSSSSDDSDDEVEDVTDTYMKSRPAPEVIELEDASSSDSDESEWEKDEYGNLRRPASYFEKKCKGRNDKSISSRDDKRSSVDDDYTNNDNEGDCKVNCSDNDEDDDNDDFIEDVTDIMLAKKQEEQKRLMEEAELLESDSEEEEKEDTKKRKKKSSNIINRRKRRKIHGESPIEVLIEEETLPDCSGHTAEDGNDSNAIGKQRNNNDDDDDVDLSVKQRIIKLLNTGLHNESNEHEARNALKLARRLLDRYNLDQAVLLKERGDGSLNDFSTTNDSADSSSLKGGIVTVNILNRKKTTPLSSMPRWIENLIEPVTTNFRVDAFVTFSKAKGFLNGGKCSVSFFGVKTNAQASAYAFKTAAERIAFMTASYDPPRATNMVPRQASLTRTARLSYAVGIVAGLQKHVEQELKEEEEKRQENLRRARSAAKTGEAYHEDEHDCGQYDEDIKHREQISVEEKLKQLENEQEARLALIDHNKKIAEDVLKVRDQCFLKTIDIDQYIALQRSNSSHYIHIRQKMLKFHHHGRDAPCHSIYHHMRQV